MARHRFLFGCTFYVKVLNPDNDKVEYEKSGVTIINLDQITLIDTVNSTITTVDGTKLYPDSHTMFNITSSVNA